MKKINNLKTLFVLALVLFFVNNINAQVRVASTAGTPDVSAMLDIVSTNKGLLIPRVDLDDVSTAAPITSPATGLLVYNSGGDEPDGFYYWSGSKWIILNAEDTQEVSDFQDTDQEPTGFIECSSWHGWFITPNASIPDPGTLNMTMTGVTQTGKICDINVEIEITHSFDADLDITIESPNGTIVELTTDNGGNGNNYKTTVFDDEASTSITAGSAPFNGSYQPEGSLSDFDGESPTGSWILHVTDDSGVDSGTLDKVTLWISSTETVPWEYVGEASITYRAGSTPVVSAYYSANPSNDTGSKIRISRSTTAGSGTLGTPLAYSATSPPRGGTTTIQGEIQEYWISMNAFYHDDATLTDGTTYYYKLWKAGKAETGQENYAIIPILINE